MTKNKATTDLKNWKVLFKVVNKEDKSTKNLEEKILKLIKDENLSTMSYAFDFYTENENFLTLQGIKTEGFAYYVASLLNDNKKYKVTESAIVIASENYKVVQIKKNFEEYLTFKRNSDIPVPAVEQVPTQKNSNVDSKAIEKTETLPASNTKKNEAQKSLKESNPK